jgi:hypothetical protein
MLATVFSGILVALQVWTLGKVAELSVKLATVETILGRLPCELNYQAECLAKKAKTA